MFVPIFFGFLILISTIYLFIILNFHTLAIEIEDFINDFLQYIYNL